MRTDHLEDLDLTDVTRDVMAHFLQFGFMQKFGNLAVNGAGWGSQGILGLTTPKDFFECGDGQTDAFGYFELYLYEQEEQVPIDEFAQLMLRFSHCYDPKNNSERSELPVLRAAFQEYCVNLESNHMQWLTRNTQAPPP